MSPSRSLRPRRCLLAALSALSVLLVAVPAASAAEGDVTDFSVPTAGAYPYVIAAGPDGALWFTETYADQLGRITPSGMVTEFALRPGAFPIGMTAGPDGNLWFTEATGAIGQITPSGMVTEFTAGITVNSQPQEIVAGPDGNLWFTEYMSGLIGRITPSGVVTEFSAGITPGATPMSIAAGPDGALWFTESSGERIGRITTTGVVTEFPTGPGTRPFWIATGPDGNLWFTDNGGAQIGRITPSGLITAFSAGLSGGILTGITAGPDGNLWAADTGGAVDRITTAGVMTEFRSALAPGTDPYALATGPDGNIWFTQPGGNRVSRIEPGPAAAAPLPPPPVLAPAPAPAPGCTGPTVTAVTPPVAAPGSLVTLTGAGFGCAHAVRFGDASATFTVDGDEHISVTVPSGVAGAVGVRVLDDAGAGTGPAAPFAALTPGSPAAAPEAPLVCARVPALTGRTLAGARTVLARDGCRVTPTLAPGATRRRGARRVTRQSVRPGTPLRAGDALVLTLR